VNGVWRISRHRLSRLWDLRHGLRVSALVVVATVVLAAWLLAQRLRDGDGTMTGSVSVATTRILETSAPASARVSAEEGAVAPDFEALLLDGARVKLSDYRGRAVVLNFWATWCGSCLAEIPQLSRVQQERGQQGLVVIGVNVGESAARANRVFRDELGAGYASVTDRDRVLARAYHVRGVPVTVFIDRAGVVRKYIVGETSHDIFDRFARVALGEQNVQGADDPLPPRFVSPLPPEDRGEGAGADGGG
jgi:peroxiredoxin